MSIDGPTNMFDGELAALQRSREMESLNTSPVSRALSNIADVISQFGVPGVGLFAKVLKSEQTPIAKVVEQVESGAYSEIARIWKHIEGQDAKLEEFNTRLQSQEAHNAYFSATLHGIRTSDPNKHFRLGALTINSVYVNDLKPESLDEMMRAAVEFTEHDIRVLKSIYEMQAYFFTPAEMSKPYNFRIDAIRSRWKTWWENDGSTYLVDGGEAFRSSTARLQSTGLIISIGLVDVLTGPSINDFELLLEGKKFYERLQEIAIPK